MATKQIWSIIWQLLITAMVYLMLSFDCNDVFFANCSHPDSIINVVAFDNNHFLVVPVVVLSRHVQLARALFGGRR